LAFFSSFSLSLTFSGASCIRRNVCCASWILSKNANGSYRYPLERCICHR
jgi:hypothetical protein